MKLSPDDSKLTAYALGELDETERAAIELELKHSAECRQAVEEIRQTAGLLTTELAKEPCPEPLLSKTDLPALEPRKIIHLPRSRFLVRTGLAALAASIVAMASWKMWFSDAKPPQQHAAHQPSEIVASEISSAEKQRVDRGTRMQNAKLLYEAGNLDEAEKAVQQVFTEDPQDRAAYTYMMLIKERRYQEEIDKRELSAREAMLDVARDWNPPVKRDELPQPNPPAKVDLIADASKPAAYWSSYSASSDQNQIVAARPALSPPPVPGLAQNKMDSGGGRGVGGGDARPKSFESAGVSLAGNGQNGGKLVLSFSADGSSAKDAPATVPGQPLVPSEQRSYRSRLLLPLYGREDSFSERLAANGSDDSAFKSQLSGIRAVGEQSPSPITAYSPFIENPFLTVLDQPLSTFSVDVDTASYANVRRFLNQGQLPPRDAVRIEEMLNYFSYRYPQPKGDEPFAANIETAGCPWNTQHRLVRIALKGRDLPQDKRPPSNFVFLIDVSGSMQPAERLPLIKQALRQLVKKMTASDRVALVVYASQAGVRLASTSCEQKEQILAAIDALEAGGSTNGGEGIQQAYGVAAEHFIKGGVNRVILCTDGDFNVGLTDQSQLIQLIKDKARSGVFLTTLGVGTDNYKDALMQKLADKGNGNYHYLDTPEEAQKVLIEQMNATLVTIAKDVKIQIEFNPAQVAAYRLIGYEKRLLRTKDFNDDTKDAGEIGAGHTVTALYEIVPPGADFRPAVDNLKYQRPATRPERYVSNDSKELLTLKLRYKKPDGDTSRLLEFPASDRGGSYGGASTDFRFAAAVASFGLILRGSEHKGIATFDSILELAEAAKGADENGYRAEFLNLVKKAKALADRVQPGAPRPPGVPGAFE